MNDGTGDDRRRNWFTWGIVCACTSSIPFLVMMVNGFRRISPEKATGLGAVAGGLVEGYVTLGSILTLILPLGAILLLCKSFSGVHRANRVLLLLSICWSAFLLLVYGLGAWMVFVEMPALARGSR